MAKVEMNKATSELLITVDADKKLWKTEQEKAFQKLAANLSRKGFRKGQVPIEIARKAISQTDIFTEAIQKTLDELVKVAAKDIKPDVIVLDSPTYKVERISDVDLTVTFVYPVYPEVKLGEYKNVKAIYKEEPVTEKQVENEIAQILASRTEWAIKDGAIAKGDKARFDFEGFLDGKPFANGKAENYELEIGSGQFIPGFEDQMVGLEPKVTKDIKVTFPNDYHANELKGKAVTFKIKVHEVKAKKVPKLSDSLVASLNIPAAKTAVELKHYISNVFKQQAEQNARNAFQRTAFEAIRANLNVAIPAALIAREMQQQEKAFAENLKKQGLDFKKYSEMSGQTPEQMRAHFRSVAETRLKDSLIFAEIAKLEKITITPADYEAAYIKYSVLYGQTPESVKGMITKAQLQVPLTNDKVLDMMIKASGKHVASSKPQVKETPKKIVAKK